MSFIHPRWLFGISSTNSLQKSVHSFQRGGYSHFSQLSACHKLYRTPNKTRLLYVLGVFYMLFCFRDKKNRGLSQRCVFLCFVWFFPRFKRSCLEPYGKNLKSKTCQVSTCHWTAARRHPWQTRRSPGKIGLLANVYLVGGWTNPSEKY